MLRRTLFLGALTAVAATICTVPGIAQDQTIRVVFPYAAGGSGDAISRIVAEAIQTTLGKTAIVENRVGAAGRTGVKSVISAPPDGKTLLVTPIAPISVFPHVYGDNLGYDPMAELEPVSQIGTFDFSLAVANRVPAKNMAELITWLKANPSEQSFGTPGAGTLPYFFALQFSKAAGLDLRHVSYRGSAAAISDLVGGQVPIVVTTTSDVVTQQQAGAIRVLATSEKQSFMAGIPTFKDAGLNITGNGWYAVYAPAKTPVAILDDYNRAIVAALKQPGVVERLTAIGLTITGTSRDALRTLQTADSDLWGPIIKASGFKPGQ